jgi:hypothetical protein
MKNAVYRPFSRPGIPAVIYIERQANGKRATAAGAPNRKDTLFYKSVDTKIIL